jgi:hypothetical protein
MPLFDDPALEARWRARFSAPRVSLPQWARDGRPTKTVGDQLFGRPVVLRRRQVRISASAVASRWSAYRSTVCALA